MEDLEKRARRPRIGEKKLDDEMSQPRYEKVSYDEPSGDSAERPAQSERPNNYRQRQGGYNQYNDNYNQGGYNRQGGYNNRQGGYGNNRQGGYDNQGNYGNRQGGYNNTCMQLRRSAYAGIYMAV